jgi:RNA ligase
MSLPFALYELHGAVNAGRVTARRHPTLPYTIYNYSPEIQFSNDWDDVTLNCRGLILDDDFNIVARPWRKFFNLGQVNLPVQFDTPVEVMDKVDGSLGILYPEIIENDVIFDIHWKVATRGSFESDQAIFATKLYKDKYSEYDPLPGYTMLFEIIFPSNRIVLDYGDMEDLILLGAVENATGYYVGPHQASYLWTKRGPRRETIWPGPVVDVMPFNTISDALGQTDRPNAEGYVIRAHNFIVKIKQPDYLELHRLVTNASPKTVWEQLRQGKSKSEIVSAFPDEFHGYVGSMIDPLLEAFDKRVDEIMDGYQKAYQAVFPKPPAPVALPSRKDFAQAFAKHKDRKYYFLLLDNRSIRDVLWVELKPTDTGGRNADSEASSVETDST